MGHYLSEMMCNTCGRANCICVLPPSTPTEEDLYKIWFDWGESTEENNHERKQNKTKQVNERKSK